MNRLTAMLGIAYVAVMAGVIVIGPLGYPGYNSLSQHISEMGATGAPHGPLISALFIATSVLLIAFWLLGLKALPFSALRAAGLILLAVNGAGLLGAGVYPCDFQCARSDPSVAQQLHDLFGGLGYLSGVLGLFLLAPGLRGLDGWARLFPLIMTCAVVAALSLPLIAPDFPWHGAAQRVLEAAFMIAVLAVAMRLWIRPPADMKP
jgi:hypothetical membrane protein